MLEKREKKIRRGFNLSPEVVKKLDKISSERRINKSEITETALKNLFTQVDIGIEFSSEFMFLLGKLSEEHNMKPMELMKQALKDFGREEK